MPLNCKLNQEWAGVKTNSASVSLNQDVIIPDSWCGCGGTATEMRDADLSYLLYWPSTN